MTIFLLHGLLNSAIYQTFPRGSGMEKKPADSPTKTHPERPQEEAIDLKAARETRGLSLTALFESTRVSKINLEAIESEAFDRLPPPVYTRDFIRKYAQAVGIDEKPILERYEKHLQGKPPLRGESEVQKPWPEDSRRNRFLIITLASVICAGILVSVLFLHDQGGRRAAPSETVESTPESQAVPAPPSEKPSKSGEDPLADTPSSIPREKDAQAGTTTTAPITAALAPVAPSAEKKLRLVIEARELTWIRIKEDQNPSLELLLKPGDRVERTASDAYQLDIGNAGGIALIFQGKRLDTLGKSGEVIHIRLPEKAHDKPSP